MLPNRKIIFVITLLSAIVIFWVQCMGRNSPQNNDARGNLFAGAKSCESCHAGIAHSYLHTNHRQTSAKVSYEDLKKYVSAAGAILYYNDSSAVKVEEKAPAFFQVAITDDKPVRSEKMDIAIGSAEKAQTYAYWKDGQLFQLPLTYFTSLRSFTNSPGYPMQKPYFDRMILSRCFECHTSFVSKADIPSGPLQVIEKMDSNSIVFGIDCERCHGPAAEHVAFHSANPAVKEARFMVSIKSLPRQRQLDLCSVCHSGNDMDVQQSLFAFRPGDTLDHFYFPHFGSSGADPDVHGKQMQLLQASKCFQQSNMTCTTCHDAHLPAANKMDAVVEKCSGCHRPSSHITAMQTNVKNCVDCHMPLQVSKSLDFNDGRQKRSIPYLLRTHLIKVYPDTE